MEALSGLVLFLMTSCTGAVTVDICNDKNATFRWDDYEVTPFHAVEWYVNRTLMADIFEDRLSQKSLRINADYKSRFVLLEEDKIGFNLTNVTKNDEGNYACILTLKGTGTLQEVNETLNVKGCQRRKRDTDAGEQPCYCSKEDEDGDERPPGSGEEEEQPPVSWPPGNDFLAVICLPVAVIIAIAVLVAVVVVKRKRSPEVKKRTKSYELVEQDKNESPVQQQ